MAWTRRATLTGAAALPFAGLARAADEGVKFPFRVTHNCPWTSVAFNGKPDPLPFLIDTGSTDFAIAQGKAEALGLSRDERTTAQGAVGRFQSTVYRAHMLVIGGAIREDDVYLSSLPGELGEGLAGLIPAARFGVMGVDFDAEEVTISARLGGEPAGYKALDILVPGHHEAGTAELLGKYSGSDLNQLIMDLRPIVSAELDGQRVDLLLDTGSDGTLYLTPDYVKKHGLWDRYPKAETTVIHAVSAKGAARVVRAERLKIGNVVFASPIITLGDPADSNRDGSGPVAGYVGMEFLRRLNFITDPRRQRIWLKPNKAVGDVYRYDRAGLQVAFVSGEPRVVALTTGGPAERAGLKLGDKVLSWSGQGGVDALRWALQGVPGSKIDLRIERGGQPSVVSVVLEERL